MEHVPAIDLSRDVDELGTLLQQTSPLTYLGRAEALLDGGHRWQDAVRTARADLMAKIASPNSDRTGISNGSSPRRLGI